MISPASVASVFQLYIIVPSSNERLKGGMPMYKFVANKSLTAIENWAFGMKLAEYHSGYMVYARKALERIPFNKLSDYFDFDLEMIVMARVAGLRIAVECVDESTQTEAIIIDRRRGCRLGGHLFQAHRLVPQARLAIFRGRR